MDLAYELHDLVRTLDRQAETILRAERMSFNRYLAAVILGEHPGMTSRQLAGAVGVSEPAMSGIVRKLRADGLVDDASPAGTGNVRQLLLTPAGEQKVADCGRRLGSRLDDLARTRGIDPAELAATVHTLHVALREDPASEG